jgi:serine/threonine-protein kinase HipA
MTSPENRYGVWLKDRRAGTLHQRGDYTWFTIDEDYALDPNRPVLGLQFEQDLYARHASAMRLPAWFSNLLPEGVLRTWIADERGVSADREMELLAQVGHDLPGAVRVLPEGSAASDGGWDPAVNSRMPEAADIIPEWRFSLAGVSLKFSMLDLSDRLTLPAVGDIGDTIVKLPDRAYPEVPRNEFVMMSLARAVGIDVPDVKLVHRDQLSGLPEAVWPEGENLAYAVRRFDRDDNRSRIHIEDFAQVRNFYPREKYNGNFETLAALIYRGHDVESLREFARRLAFNILIGNGDAHLKNWSLIYHNPRIPALAPAYDLVATSWYRPDSDPEDMGLRFGGSRRFETVRLIDFDILERRIGAEGAGLRDVVTKMIRDVQIEWPKFASQMDVVPKIRDGVTGNIEARSRSLLIDGSTPQD